MELALGKKGLAEVLVQAVMSLYKGSRTKVRVGLRTSNELGVWVDVHQESVLSRESDHHEKYHEKVINVPYELA